MTPPSFSSFPPSFASFPEQARSDATNSDRQTTQDLPRSKRDKQHRSTKSKTKRSEKDKRADDISEDEGVGFKEEDERVKRRDNTLFFTDRRGDPFNVTYGGLHTHDIPKHHLVGRGIHVLGLPVGWRVLRREGRGIEIGLSDRKSNSKTLTDSSSRKLLAAPPRHILTGHLTYRYDESEDGYLRLPSRSRRTDPESSYRSITSHQRVSGSDTSSEDDSGLSEESTNEHPSRDRRQSTLQQLESLVATNPTSTTTWLSLLSHTLSTTPTTSKNASSIRAEITVSVLRRAFDAHSNNKASYILLSRYLTAGEEIWHESKLRSEWTHALAAAPLTDIWMDWLEWRLRINVKGVEGIVEDGMRCLSQVQNERNKIRVFWRLAIALEDAGFIERAIAMFQALAELTFKCPALLLKAEFSTQLKALEEFWESEVPRLGERGAKGWSSWTEKPGDEMNVTAQPLAPMISHVKDEYRLWAEQELALDQTQRLPLRSTQDSLDPDPFATILFTDIQPFLFPVMSKEAKECLRLAWVSFLGLPIPGFCPVVGTDGGTDEWKYGYFIRQSYKEILLPSGISQNGSSAQSHAGTIIGTEKRNASPFGPVKSWSFGVIEPLELCLLEQEPRLWYLGREDTTSFDDQILRNVLAQLRLGDEDYDWDQLSIAYEAQKGLKGALKVSRQLLSRLQGSARHWSYHAKLERLRGVDGARKVYEHVLGPSSICVNDQYALRMWWDWVELEWLDGQKSKAISIIMRAVGEGGSGNMAVLRARRAIDEKIADNRLSWKEREALIKMKALIALLNSSIEDALLVFDAYTPQEHVAQESLAIASLTLLVCHTRLLKHPSPPAILQRRAKSAFGKYPQNSIILGIFLESERGQSIWGRARLLFNEDDEGPRKGLLRRVQELWLAGWERGGQDIQIERARNTLEAAVMDPRTRLNSTIWRLYVLFEIRCGELARAKNLIYRGIKMAPLTKSLYLLAFTVARDAFKSSELVSLADSMAERGIRTRKGLDEMELEGDGEGNMSEDSVEDEIEREAAETRRLRPY